MYMTVTRAVSNGYRCTCLIQLYTPLHTPPPTWGAPADIKSNVIKKKIPPPQSQTGAREKEQDDQLLILLFYIVVFFSTETLW